MITILYDDLCERTEKAVALCKERGITFSVERVSAEARKQYGVSAGPIILQKGVLIGTLETLTYILKENKGPRA